MVGIGYVGNLQVVRNFIADYNISFTMLWSESTRPTSHYYDYAWRSWSGFWLLDRNGDRVVSGLYENAAQIEELLADLE